MVKEDVIFDKVSKEDEAFLSYMKGAIKKLDPNDKKYFVPKLNKHLSYKEILEKLNKTKFNCYSPVIVEALIIDFVNRRIFFDACNGKIEKGFTELLLDVERINNRWKEIEKKVNGLETENKELKEKIKDYSGFEDKKNELILSSKIEALDGVISKLGSKVKEKEKPTSFKNRKPKINDEMKELLKQL